jgi:hypothetical protein
MGRRGLPGHVFSKPSTAFPCDAYI